MGNRVVGDGGDAAAVRAKKAFAVVKGSGAACEVVVESFQSRSPFRDRLCLRMQGCA